PPPSQPAQRQLPAHHNYLPCRLFKKHKKNQESTSHFCSFCTSMWSSDFSSMAFLRLFFEILLCLFDLLCAFCDLFCSHVHPVSASRLATATMLLAVDRDATLETDPHTTQWPTRLACHRTSKCKHTCFQNRRRHHASSRHLDCNAVNDKRDHLRHAPAPAPSAPADKA